MMAWMDYVVDRPELTPVYKTEGAAGMDLWTATRVTLPGATYGVQMLTDERYLVVGERPTVSLHRELVSTGVRVSLPPMHVGLVRGRSSVWTKLGVHTFEGTLDEDYRGYVHVSLCNLSDEDVVIPEGVRVAQLVVVPVTRCILRRVKELQGTVRGEDGFGSSGER